MTLRAPDPASTAEAHGPVIGADLRRTGGGLRVERLLGAFRDLRATLPELRLVLATRRHRTDHFSVANWIDRHNLRDAIGHHPYFDVCRDFPIRKRDCAAWIDDATPDDLLTAEGLARIMQHSRQKSALFVTPFHPARPDGATTLMRQWLVHLRAAGYRVDLLHYATDGSIPDRDLVPMAVWPHDRLIRTQVLSPLVGHNAAGLNVHVDDWCGDELLETVDGIVAAGCHDVAIVNYAFLSAVFDRIPPSTHRILLTHDRFTDRARRMLADGFAKATWVSLDQAGETLALRRADTVVALQDAEADDFRHMAGAGADVRVIGPVPRGTPIAPSPPGERLRIGYLGSGNRVNEASLADLLGHWDRCEVLRDGAELVLGGEVCETLAGFVSPDLLARTRPRMLGPVPALRDFYAACDLVMNPERGGTGIKIKSLDAMAHGMPLVSTRAGMAGIESAGRHHSAPDNAALATLLAGIATDRTLLAEVAEQTAIAWAAYVHRHGHALETLLGPACDDDPGPTPLDPLAAPPARLQHLPGQSWKMRLLFRPDGLPVPIFRTLLFRADGLPRRIFRRIVLKRSGLPRPAFREWMLYVSRRG